MSNIPQLRNRPQTVNDGSCSAHCSLAFADGRHSVTSVFGECVGPAHYDASPIPRELGVTHARRQSFGISKRCDLLQQSSSTFNPQQSQTISGLISIRAPRPLGFGVAFSDTSTNVINTAASRHTSWLSFVGDSHPGGKSKSGGYRIAIISHGADPATEARFLMIHWNRPRRSRMALFPVSVFQIAVACRLGAPLARSALGFSSTSFTRPFRSPNSRLELLQWK